MRSDNYGSISSLSMTTAARLNESIDDAPLVLQAKFCFFDMDWKEAAPTATVPVAADSNSRPSVYAYALCDEGGDIDHGPPSTPPKKAARIRYYAPAAWRSPRFPSEGPNSPTWCVGGCVWGWGADFRPQAPHQIGTANLWGYRLLVGAGTVFGMNIKTPHLRYREFRHLESFQDVYVRAQGVIFLILRPTFHISSMKETGAE